MATETTTMSPAMRQVWQDGEVKKPRPHPTGLEAPRRKYVLRLMLGEQVCAARNQYSGRQAIGRWNRMERPAGRP